MMYLGSNAVGLNNQVMLPVNLLTITFDETTSTTAQGYDHLQNKIGGHTRWVAFSDIQTLGSDKGIVLVGSSNSNERSIYRADNGYGGMRRFPYSSHVCNIPAGQVFYVFLYDNPT